MKIARQSKVRYDTDYGSFMVQILLFVREVLKNVLKLCKNCIDMRCPSQNRTVVLQDLARFLQESCKITYHLARSCKILANNVYLARSYKNLGSCKMIRNLARSCKINVICKNLARSCKMIRNLARFLQESCKILQDNRWSSSGVEIFLFGTFSILLTKFSSLNALLTPAHISTRGHRVCLRPRLLSARGFSI